MFSCKILGGRNHCTNFHKAKLYETLCSVTDCSVKWTPRSTKALTVGEKLHSGSAKWQNVNQNCLHT